MQMSKLCNDSDSKKYHVVITIITVIWLKFWVRLVCCYLFGYVNKNHKNANRLEHLATCNKNEKLNFFECRRLFPSYNTYGPGHAKMCLMPYANNKGADQPVHPRSLSSAFVIPPQTLFVVGYTVFALSVRP